MNQSLIIIPVHNEGLIISSLINDLKKLSIDILVIDDYSIDGCCDNLARNYSINVIKNKSNLGYEKSLNKGITYAKNLNYKYPSSKKVVIEDCNLEISRGDTIGIKGKTGVGKSTLINLIMGLIKPSKGKIKVNGTDINDDKEEMKLIQWRKSIAHVPQFIFISDISIIENIAFGEKIKDINFDKLVFCEIGMDGNALNLAYFIFIHL